MRRGADPYEYEQDPYAASGGGRRPPVRDPLQSAIENSFRAPDTRSLYTSPGQPVGEPVGAKTYDTSRWNTGGYSTPQYVAESYGNALGGYDPNNWNDPTMQTPKYVVGRILSNYPANVQGLTAAMADIQRAYPGTTFNGKDVITIPGVGSIDVGRAFDQNMGDATTDYWWGALTDASGRPYETGGPAPVVPPTTGGGRPADAGGNASAFQDAIRRRILEIMGQSQTPSVTDPDIQPLAQTHDAALQRARRMSQASLAERHAQAGTLNTGGFDADVAGTMSDYGAQQAGFEAGLVNEKAKERRAQIMQALSLASGLMDSDLERRLRAELAAIDDATRRYGLGLANTQFYDQLGFDQSKTEALLNQNLIMQLLYGREI